MNNGIGGSSGGYGGCNIWILKNGRKNWNETRQNRSKRLYYIYLFDFYVLYTFITLTNMKFLKFSFIPQSLPFKLKIRDPRLNTMYILIGANLLTGNGSEEASSDTCRGKSSVELFSKSSWCTLIGDVSSNLANNDFKSRIVFFWSSICSFFSTVNLSIRFKTSVLNFSNSSLEMQPLELLSAVPNGAKNKTRTQKWAIILGRFSVSPTKNPGFYLISNLLT